MDQISELHDCILSHIQSLLSMKDLVKTSALSKRWWKLWTLRRYLNFDIHNMLGSEKKMLEAGYLVEPPLEYSIHKRLVIDLCRSQFVQGVYQFVTNFEGTKIDSFKMAFCLNWEQSSNIDQWVNFAVARRVERIDLIFSGSLYLYDCVLEHKRCKFPFDFFSEYDASTLKLMHLQNCLLWHPKEFNLVPFSNLRSLVLEDACISETLISSLLPKCLLLEELSLIRCCFTSMLRIVSSSLHHFKVSRCKACKSEFELSPINLKSLECLNLISLKCQSCTFEAFSINAPLLKRIYYFTHKFYQILNVLAHLAYLPQF